MTTDPAPIPQNGRQKSVVVVNFPGGREFVWLAEDSPIASSEVGQVVVIRDKRWRVLRRQEQADSLTLTLGLA
jgi:hypothetical protein